MHIHRIQTDRTSSEKFTSPTDNIHYHVHNGAKSSFSNDTPGHSHLFGDIKTGPAMSIEGVERNVLRAKEAKGTAMFDMTDEERGAFAILDQFINGEYDFTKNNEPPEPNR